MGIRGEGGALRDMIRMGRFHFLLAGVLCFLYGAFLALHWGAPWDPERLLLGYAIFGCGHLSLSYSNEYYDREADRHGIPGAFSGGSGILGARPELAPAAQAIALGLIAASLSLALLFQALYHPAPWFFLFIAAGNLLGWAYTAPPFSLSYRGLGEAATTIGAAFMMPGTGYLVMAGTLDLAFVLSCIPLLPLGYYFILSVELPDMEADREGGKPTAVVRKGREAALRSIAAAAFLAGALFLLSGILWPDPAAAYLVVIAVVSVIPLAAALLALRSGAGERGGAEGRTRLLVTALVLFFLFSNIVLAAGLA